MDRFWEKVNRGQPDQCWLWLAGKNNGGYGVFKRGNYTPIGAHCMSWVLTNGEIPEGKRVLHKCDVRLCVNPSHLFLGTQSDNIQDCLSKGRFALGSKHGRSKLTEEQVRKIKVDTRTLREIAADYSVTDTAIWKIQNGVKWAHLDG